MIPFFRYVVLAGTGMLGLAACSGNSVMHPYQYRQPDYPGPFHASEESEYLQAKPPVVNHNDAVLTDLNMNNEGRQVVVKPGSKVHATVHYVYHCFNCYSNQNSQIIVGLARRSAQACIYHGGPHSEGMASFVLQAPAKPGKYDVRYRILQAADCSEALDAGWNAATSPSKETTIGVVIATKKTKKKSATGPGKIPD